MEKNHEIEKITLIIKDCLLKLRSISGNIDFFDKYINTVKVFNVTNNTITLITKNDFSKLVIKNDYLNQILLFITQQTKQKFVIDLITENEQKINLLGINISRINNADGIKTDLTFDNYIECSFNKNAIIASKAIISDFVNPLFICASTGLGKTHLLHAIGNLYANKYNNRKIIYISSDDFSREIYSALFNENKMEIENTKRKYEEYDLILIDDIQLLANRNKINDILFSIFNNLINKNKYIVLASDKNPDEINGFDSRMKSRFHSGLFIEINKPEFDDLKKIISSKSANLFDNKFILTNESIEYISRRNNGDIRRLESDLNRIKFFVKNNNYINAIIDLNIVSKVLCENNIDQIKKFGYDVDPNRVINEVSMNYGIKPEQIISKSRVKKFIIPRWICMYILRQKFNMTFNQIGQYFSGRDHSSVKFGIENIEKSIKSDNYLKLFIENIIKKF